MPRQSQLSASLFASTARRRSIANCNSEPRSHERWLELSRRPLRRRTSSCSGSPALVCHRSILEAFDVQFSMRNLDSQAPVEALLVVPLVHYQGLLRDPGYVGAIAPRVIASVAIVSYKSQWIRSLSFTALFSERTGS
jgi:hypothetical protein